ncbi:uncharacterized protein ACA1_062550 [Acanthamoeba castellanii str. Neff]|uniref:Uncharacterized protein n=1 Tax=Acanthamoeba castellanii (strain ATCC 30010 / Neff) TaxID=1257118 RepID=L8GZH6_ACACF|nr:uncharacterized protein ACA1_062550 [Acanthamoeba castellanii str. Neff]ELR17511.1 hypothetical protein ACA1_062550 [Acanthamoeba castellanii str. Neff]
MFRMGEASILDNTAAPPSGEPKSVEARQTTAQSGENEEDERGAEEVHVRSGGEGGPVILVTHRANNILPGKASSNGLTHSNSTGSQRRRVWRQRSQLAGGSVLVANSFRELEDLVEVVGAHTTKTSPAGSSSAQARAEHTSVEDDLTTHGTDVDSADEQGSSESERRSTEGEMTAEDGPFPRRHVEVTAAEMAELRAGYEKGHAFVVCVLTRTRSGRQDEESESESDVSSEGEDEARERQKRIADKAHLMDPSRAMAESTSAIESKEHSMPEAVENDAEKEMSYQQVEGNDNENDEELEEEKGVSVQKEEESLELRRRLFVGDSTTTTKEIDLEGQIEQKIRERIECERLRRSDTHSTPSSPYSLTHSSSSLNASHSSVALTLDGDDAEDSEVAGSAFVSPLLSPTPGLSLSPSPDPERDQLNQQILAALTSKDDELDEDELRLLDMRRAHSNDGEDDHGFSLTSPQPKAFAQNLEKIYSSLEQVDAEVLFPEQQRLAMIDYENRIKQGVERRAKEREERLNSIMAGYKRVLGMEEPAVEEEKQAEDHPDDAIKSEEKPPDADNEDEEVLDKGDVHPLSQEEEVEAVGGTQGEVGAKTDGKEVGGQEEEEKSRRLWFEDIADDQQKARELIDKRKSERKKRRKSKLRKRKGHSVHSKEEVLVDYNGSGGNKVVVLLAFKHPTTRDGRLFIPLSRLDPPTGGGENVMTAPFRSTNSRGERNGSEVGSLEGTMESGERRSAASKRTTTIYSVNTEEAAGASLDEVYASYYSRMRKGRKKAEEAVHEKNRNLTETEELAWHHLANLLVLYERKVISKQEYELRRSLIAGSFSSTRLAAPGPLPASTLSSPLLVPLQHSDDDDEDDMEEENAKPTHGLPPTFWSQLRLERLEEARFPVKLASVYELRKSQIDGSKPQTDIYWLISEASAALLRLSKESSKQMKPPRDSAAGRAAVERQEETYRRIIKAHPRHPFALYGYARFLSNVRKDDRQADQYFQLALKASPFNPEVLATYAHFLERRQRDLDKAHRFYKRAYFVDRRNADVVGAYAIFQHRMLRNYKEAERLFKQALELDKENVNLVGYYAMFLQKAKKDLSGSELYYRKALDLARGRKNLHGFWKARLKELRVEMKEARDREFPPRSRSLSWQKRPGSTGELTSGSEGSSCEDEQQSHSGGSAGRRGRSQSDRSTGSAAASEKEQLISLQDKTAMEQFLAELFAQDERAERARLEGKPVIREDKAGVELTASLLRRDMGRSVFCRVLNQQRAKRMRLGEVTFGTLCKLVRVGLEECNAARDFSSARALMHMASTFYFAPAPGSHSASPLASSQSWSGSKKDVLYLRQRVEDAPIWKNNSFWKYMFTELVCKERAKVQKVLAPVEPSPSLMSPRRLLGKTTPAAQPALLDDSREVIGLLASFGMYSQKADVYRVGG